MDVAADIPTEYLFSTWPYYHSLSISPLTRCAKAEKFLLRKLHSILKTWISHSNACHSLYMTTNIRHSHTLKWHPDALKWNRCTDLLTRIDLCGVPFRTESHLHADEWIFRFRRHPCVAAAQTTHRSSLSRLYQDVSAFVHLSVSVRLWVSEWVICTITAALL